LEMASVKALSTFSATTKRAFEAAV
jgi:hypothetical protein